MTVYSHSRLSTFEQCPLKFKFAYIDGLETDTEGIEAFMGSRVHEALQKLYDDLKFNKVNTADELVAFYREEWEKNWHDQVKIVREGITAENYRDTGERCLREYYARHTPFDEDRTIATELRITINTDGISLQGYIDRLAAKSDGVYVIHDYKTSANLPKIAELMQDRQLRLYALSVYNDYSDCKEVEIVWHYLAFDKELRFSVAREELDAIWKKVTELVKDIESCKEFPGRPSGLCDWCDYRPLCPHFKHEYMTEAMAPLEFKNDEGVMILDEYARLDSQMKELQDRLEEARQRLLAFAKQLGVSSVVGSGVKASIYHNQRMSFPKRGDSRQNEFVSIIKKLGLWEELAIVDVYGLTRMINCRELPDEIVKILEPYITRSEFDVIKLSKR